MDNYKLTQPRYESMKYRRCGKSGLLLPEISLGFWHNFGEDASREKCRQIVEFAFDNGITYFDLANNYGPPQGAAETLFGELFAQSLKSHRDEVVIATKAGHDMWPGPYGEWGSRKTMIASIDQSLKRMQLDYVDIFYSHRPDPVTPLEETMQALVDIVRAGKALYVGLSKYPPEMAARAYAYLRGQHVPCLVYQGRYNMIDTAVEQEILPQAAAEGAGFVAFSPLAQGLLTDRYLHGIPEGSRMTHSNFLCPEMLTPELLAKISAWNDEAAGEGMTLAQYALRWILRRPEVTSVIVGASSVEQLKSNLLAVK
jgi:L-glyceraldehyde 3-phosphate reductase